MAGSLPPRKLLRRCIHLQWARTFRVCFAHSVRASTDGPLHTFALTPNPLSPGEKGRRLTQPPPAERGLGG
jgi:hypothetical protein